jgi:hypothetical protein
MRASRAPGAPESRSWCARSRSGRPGTRHRGDGQPGTVTGHRRGSTRGRHDDLHPQLAGPFPRQWRHEVARPDLKDPDARGSVDIGGPDDGHDAASRPCIPSSAPTAASRAVCTSLSVPERNMRPNRPTARSSITVMFAAFSASFAAIAM